MESCCCNNPTVVDYYWRDYKGTIPQDALSAGHNVYIAQIHKDSGNLPGTYYANSNEAVTCAYDYKVTVHSNFKILCTTEPYRFRWQHVKPADVQGELLNKCIGGGHELHNSLLIGKVNHEGVWKIGKTSAKNYLWLWSNSSGGIYKTSDFEILTYE